MIAAESLGSWGAVFRKKSNYGEFAAIRKIDGKRG
jgi:hypothetical protein